MIDTASPENMTKLMLNLSVQMFIAVVLLLYIKVRNFNWESGATPLPFARMPSNVWTRARRGCVINDVSHAIG